MRRVVVDLIGLLGTNDANVVGDLLNVGKKIGNVLSRLAALFEFNFGAEALEGGVLQKGEFDPFGEFLGDGLAVVLAELGFVIEALELRRSTSHVEIDDAFGFWGVVEVAGALSEAVLEEERSEGGAGEGGRRTGEEIAARRTSNVQRRTLNVEV